MHQLTHTPFIPSCPVCRRANTKRIQHRRVADKEKKVADDGSFGRWITCDLVTPYIGDTIEAVGDIKNSILFYDVNTGWMYCKSLRAKTEEEIKHAFKMFADPGKIGNCHSDREEGIKGACESLGIGHTMGTAGAPQENAKIERQTQVLARGARALLCAAGLPQAFWTFAASTFCFLKNITPDMTGSSPWKKRYGRNEAEKDKKKFKGVIAPFGSYVLYYPPSTTKEYKQQQNI